MDNDKNNHLPLWLWIAIIWVMLLTVLFMIVVEPFPQSNRQPNDTSSSAVSDEKKPTESKNIDLNRLRIYN